MTTAVCFKYFFERNVDIAVIEAGLGGALDATNVLKRPLLSIITNIGLDHKNILGNSLEKIAMDKAGIIKKNSIAVCGEKRPGLRKLIEKCASNLNAGYFYSGDVRLYERGELLEYRGLTRLIKGISLPNKALYQKRNLKLALLSAEILESRCKDRLAIRLDDDLIRRAVSKFNNEGRFEIIKYKNTDVVLDGAHNPDGIKNLIASLRGVFTKNNFIIIFSVMKDKDYKAMLKRLASLGGVIFLTGLKNDRAINPVELEGALPSDKPFKEVFVSDNIGNSMASALKIGKKDDIIVICGSLYLVGEFKKAFLN